MPRKYVKRYNRRRRYNRGGFSSAYRTISKYTNWDTVWKAIKDVKELINVERKFFDVSQSGLAPGTAGAVYPLSQIAQGDAYNNREGNSCKVISELLRMEFALNTANEYDFMRCILFIDNENSNATPAVTDVLESANTNSSLNHVNGKRFSIIRDAKIALKKDMNATQYKTFSKLKNHLKWSSGTATDTREGHIYLLVIGAQNVNPSNFSYNNRIRFVDN